jgi:hypothetical protein
MNFNGGNNTFQSPIDVLTEIAKETYLDGWNPHAQYANLVKCKFFY